MAHQDWYEQQRPGLGLAFTEEFERAVAVLEQTPLIYPVIHRSVRRVVLRRFPHLLWFKVSGTLVTILACSHGRRDPAAVRQGLG